MAVNEKQPEKQGLRIAMLRKLTLEPESRSEPAKGQYPGGRFKRFFDVFRSNYSHLTAMNALSLLFLLPLLAGVGYISVIGMEGFAYLLEGMETPYLMQNIGIGLSAGVSAATVQAAMVTSYRVLFLVIAVGLMIFSFGFGGALHITTKMVWGESFICKKDKVGNDVPRIALEFFRGIKLYWKKTVLFTVVYALLFGGSANMILLFVEAVFLGTAGVGHYFALIFGALILLFSTLIYINLIPTVVSYRDMKLKDRLKNATIFTFAFFVFSVFILAFAVAPFLLTLAGSFMMIIAVLIIVMFGVSYLSLLLVNYADGNSERILVPLYESSQKQAGTSRPKKKEKPLKNEVKTAPAVIEVDAPAEEAPPMAEKPAKKETAKQTAPAAKKPDNKNSAKYNKRYQQYNNAKKKK